jgi:hypothetical protein
VALGIASSAAACTIPVFRYALERWELSSYEAVVFHRGDLPADTRAFLDSLTRNANVTVTLVDLDGKVEPKTAQLWDRQGRPTALPWVVVRRPDGNGKSPPVWTGPLVPVTLRQLVDSPIRQKAVAALSSGSSSVFVLLLSGDQAADNSAAALVQQQLAKLEKLVKLPEQRGEGPRIQLALPLKVSFTVLPLKRDEPGEAAFIQFLLGSEDGLAKVRGPILFPIFGRGRLLGSLYGKDLDADNLYEVVSFLCGECSCQVKDLNPGMDLPIVADWPAIFERIGPAPEGGLEIPAGMMRHGARVKPLSGLLPVAAGTSKSGGTESGVTRVALSHYPPEVHEAPTNPDTWETPAHTAVAPPYPGDGPAPYRRWLWGATGLASVLVLITGVWALLQWRRGSR